MLSNAYLLAKIRFDTAENERNFAGILRKTDQVIDRDVRTLRRPRGRNTTGERPLGDARVAGRGGGAPGGPAASRGLPAGFGELPLKVSASCCKIKSMEKSN